MPQLKIISIAIASLAVAALPSTALARHGHHQKGHNQVTVSGTIGSFQGGVLTIQRADGTMASALVTPATEIECEAPETSGAVTARIADHGGSQARQHDASGRGSDDTAVDTESASAENPADDVAEGQGTDDQTTTQTSGPGNAGQPACDSTAFLPGTPVTNATIRTPSGGGAFFKQVKLAV